MAKIPRGNADIAALGLRVATNWGSYPTLTLQWITQLDALSIANDYNNLIFQTAQTVGGKRAKVRSMQELDEIIDDNLFRLKLLIEMEYGKDRLPSYYAEFGIDKIGGGYRLTTDRDLRIQSLRVMVARLATAPFQANAYGEAYWQDLLTQYEAAKDALMSQVEQVSEKVMDKKQLRNQVQQLLRSMKMLIMANYPDTAEGMLRDFGYLDEYA